MATLKFKGKTAAAAVSSDTRPLHIRFRPNNLNEVVGQDAVVKSLKATLGKPGMSHAFLFTGPSGCGKTTLARIVGSALGVPEKRIMEIDAATNSGVADMRQVTEMAQYRALSEDGRKLIIVDEAHALSKQTWQSLLKAIEEPPEHVYWAFCTTEADKVPETIRTRCASYNLKPVDTDSIIERLTTVRVTAGLQVDDPILELVARQAQGSMRRALVYLQQVVGVADKKEAARLLETGVGEEEQAVALARMICTGKGFTWENARNIIQALDKDSPEGVRLIVINYAAAMLKNAKDPQMLLAVGQAFAGPYNPSEKWMPVYLAIGSLLYS